MGLYDSPVGALDPRSMMLMQMGMGLMRGPSTTPISLGSSLAQAGQQGLQAFQQTQQANQQQQLFQMKIAEAQREEAERAQKKAALAELMKDPRFANMGPLLQVAPQQAIERAFPKDNKPMVVAPGAHLVDPENPTKPLYSAPDKPEKVPESELTRIIRERNALPPGDPNRALFDAKIRKLTTHQPMVNVDNRQEGEFAKILGRESGEMYAGLLRAEMNAPATIGKYERLSSLLGQVNTGKFKGSTTDLKAAAKGLGINLDAMGIKDDVAPAQAARALSNQLALELRNPAGGAGMPGAMSDQDRTFLLQMVPGLENDPGSVTQMIEYRTRLARREQQVAKMARDYKQKNKKFDEGFFDQLKTWSDKTPLFPEAGKPSLPNLSPKAQKYLDAAGAN
jgi:hypothetical protein